MKPAENISEAKLILSLKNGEEAAFETLYHQHVGKVRAFLAKMRLARHADDVIQETFLTVWRRRENIKLDQSFENYLFTIAKNFALKALKKQLYLELSLDENKQMVEVVTPHETVVLDELKDNLKLAIEKLPERPREIFQLKRWEGLTTKEVAQRLGISPSTVENHMNRALSSLREDLSLPASALFLLIDFTLLSA